MTDAPNSLAEALVTLQRALPTIAKTETAKVETQRGSFSYQFAGLHAVTVVILPRLAELGLFWVCRPTRDTSGALVVAYALTHASTGEAITGEYPVMVPGNATPQMVGSALSYARRYSLLCVTGVAPEVDDDDGATASTPRPATRKATGRPSTEDGEPPDPERRKKRLFALYHEVGPEDRDARLADLSKTLGRPVESSSDLTADDVETAIKTLEKRKREQRRKSTDG